MASEHASPILDAMLSGVRPFVVTATDTAPRPLGGRTVVMVQPYAGRVDTLHVDLEHRIVAAHQATPTRALADAVSGFATATLARLPDDHRHIVGELLQAGAAILVVRVDVDAAVATLVLVPAGGGSVWSGTDAQVLGSISAVPALTTH